VVKESNKTLVDVQAGYADIPNYCGLPSHQRPQFDGRYAAWRADGGFRVLDVRTGALVPAKEGGLTKGRVAAIEGDHYGLLAVQDLATGRTATVAAPAQARWLTSNPGAAVAIPGTARGAHDGLWVLDPVSLSWLVNGTRVDTGANGSLVPAMASQDWVVLRETVGYTDSWWSHAIASAVTTPLRLNAPAGDASTGQFSQPEPVAIVAGRIYFYASAGSGGPPSQKWWSVDLASGGDARLGAPPAAAAGNRTAELLRSSGYTTSGTPPATAISAAAPSPDDAGTAADAPEPSVSRSQAAPAGLLVAIALLASALWVRRRLP
jgi:hypothetical protein